MEKIVKASPVERRRVFQTAAAALRIAPEMIEKDFWVCRILQKLFQDGRLRRILRFKGGTSLSKAFRLIRRFSEDVDLILDWRCVAKEDPSLSRSNAKQDSFNKSLQESAGQYIASNLRTMIDAAMGEVEFGGFIEVGANPLGDCLGHDGVLLEEVLANTAALCFVTNLGLSTSDFCTNWNRHSRIVGKTIGL